MLNHKPVEVEATGKGHKVTLRIQSHVENPLYKLDVCDLIEGKIVLQTDSFEKSDVLAQTFRHLSHILERDVSEAKLIKELDKRYVLKNSEDEQ